MQQKQLILTGIWIYFYSMILIVLLSTQVKHFLHFLYFSLLIFFNYKECRKCWSHVSKHFALVQLKTNKTMFKISENKVSVEFSKKAAFSYSWSHQSVLNFWMYLDLQVLILNKSCSLTFLNNLCFNHKSSDHFNFVSSYYRSSYLAFNNFSLVPDISLRNKMGHLLQLQLFLFLLFYSKYHLKYLSTPILKKQ